MTHDEKIQSAYDKILKPQGLLPPDLIPAFEAQDPAALEEARDWLKRNGQVILTVRGLIDAKDNVMLSDEGYIILRPHKRVLSRQIKIKAVELGVEDKPYNIKKLALLVKYGSDPL